MDEIDIDLVKEIHSHCVWGNSRETALDWYEKLLSDDEDGKKQLFKKIFFEMPDAWVLNKIFNNAEIMSWLNDLDKPFPRAHLEKRRKIWRYLFLGIQEPIPELDWIISHGKTDE